MWPWFASFGFIFPINTFWLVIPQQRKKWLSLDSSFVRVSVVTAITLIQEEFCFGRVLVSVFVRFAFARLDSARLRSAWGARRSSRDYTCIRRYGTAVSWNGTLYRGAISKACWNYLNVYGRGGGREEGQAFPPFPAITPSPVEV